MKWISVQDKMPEIGQQDILMSDGESLCFGFFGHTGDTDKERQESPGFIDYSSWNDYTGYTFDPTIKYWMIVDKPKTK